MKVGIGGSRDLGMGSRDVPIITDRALPDTAGRVVELLSDGTKRYLVAHDTLG